MLLVDHVAEFDLFCPSAASFTFNKVVFEERDEPGADDIFESFYLRDDLDRTDTVSSLFIAIKFCNEAL